MTRHVHESGWSDQKLEKSMYTYDIPAANDFVLYAPEKENKEGNFLKQKVVLFQEYWRSAWLMVIEVVLPLVNKT